MKREIKIISVFIFIFVLTFWVILLIMSPEPHFKITKEGVEVDEIDNNKWQIKKSDLTLEWLEENCLKDNSNKYICGEYFVEVWNQIK